MPTLQSEFHCRVNPTHTNVEFHAYQRMQRHMHADTHTHNVMHAALEQRCGLITLRSNYSNLSPVQWAGQWGRVSTLSQNGLSNYNIKTHVCEGHYVYTFM